MTDERDSIVLLQPSGEALAAFERAHAALDELVRFVLAPPMHDIEFQLRAERAARGEPDAWSK